MAFGHLEDPLGPLDSCKKKNWTPTYTPPAAAPPTPCTEFFFVFLLPYQFLFQSDNFSILPHILPHILPQILPQTTTSIAIHPPTTFSVPKRNTGKCFERPAKILRGMQSSVPKRNTGKCLLTVGTDVKNVTEGRGTEGRGGKEGTRLGFLCGWSIVGHMTILNKMYPLQLLVLIKKLKTEIQKSF